MMKYCCSFSIVFLTVFIFYIQVSEGCSGRLIRFGGNVIRDLFSDWKINFTKPLTRDFDEEEKKLKEFKNTLKTLILPENEYYREIRTLHGLTMYTDEMGCYEKGYSKEYHGLMDYTETSRKCSNWSVFDTMLRSRVVELIEEREEANNFSIIKLERTAEELEKYHKSSIGIAVINQTINTLKNYGAFFHSYCRDPDGVGRPWCFIEMKNDLEWEYCPVPVCTKCWRIRQRAVRGRFRSLMDVIKSKKIWIPECTFTGKFHHTQCWKKYCWCVTENGILLEGTLKKKGSKKLNCEQVVKNAKNKKKPKKRKIKPWYIKEKIKPEQFIRQRKYESISKRNKVDLPKKAQDDETKRTETKRIRLDKLGDDRRHECEIKYFYSRKLKCKGNNCWVVLQKKIYSWSCFRDIKPGNSNERYITWFARRPNLSGGGSKFTGGRWKCNFFKDKTGSLQKNCTMIRSMSYEIRRREGKRIICFTLHGHEDKETCHEF
uniref:uncharacterized protein LOC120338249 n=1 Tax=Styela clava TaxID=7725 RepID=UPI0019398619|nr:uncharacterized protein LOC120338249 [Styela clava]